MEKISVVIIVCNGEKYLSEVLESAKKIADEIVIVIDAKTTDKTARIAKKFGAKIYIQKWLGYARQKNFAISKTKNTWILSLDADEVLDFELIASIQKADSFPYDGFYLARKNHFGKEWIAHCGWYPNWQIRLFKKNKMSFAKKEVHEQVTPSGKIGYLKGNIIHYTYQDNSEYFTKIEHYTDLDARILFAKKRKWSIFYQIGKPIKEFWQMFIGKKGFLDGWLGLKICFFSAYYRWLVAKKLRKLYEDRD